ncbi:MAG: phage tail assembly chaperone [Desulfovibrionaceae bacterium]|nr:phage tail assembly chaperone [Desulfovibrionaceae bacterium]
MFRYPDETYRQTPPAKVEYNGYIRRFYDLTRAEWDELGYNEAVAMMRQPFTAYATAWDKGEDLIYRETVAGAEVDEVARSAFHADQVRAERDRLLAESDWTQLADSPLDAEEKASWAAYRQALREVPQQEGFPYAVVWPTAPEA